MRRMVIGLSALTMIPLACVSGDAGSMATGPYPVYHVRRPARPISRPRPVERPKTYACKPILPPKTTTSFSRSWFPRSRRISPRWTHIVIHHSATDEGGARRFDKYHRECNGWDELGYHFVIGNGTDTPDGSIEVGSRWHKQKHGAHCKTPDNYFNEHGIGICLVGDFTDSSPTRAQMAALEGLVRFLSAQRGIPPARVVTHNSVTHKTACPGRHFRLTSVRRALSHPPVATVMPH